MRILPSKILLRFVKKQVRCMLMDSSRSPWHDLVALITWPNIQCHYNNLLVFRLSVLLLYLLGISFLAVNLILLSLEF